MLGNHGFERTFFAKGRRILRAQYIQIRLRARFFQLLRFDQATKLADFFRDPAGALADAFKFEGELAALPAKSFHLAVRSCNLGVQAPSLSVGPRQAFLALLKLV